MGAVGRGDMDRWGHTECHFGRRKPGNNDNSHNCKVMTAAMDLMSHISGTFIGQLYDDDRKHSFLPQVNADFSEAELIPAVTECTPKVIHLDFMQLF